MKFAHTNIITSDWKRLSDFYIKVFKCQYVPPTRKQQGTWLDKGTGLKNAELHGVHLRLPGFQSHGPTLEIFQYREIIDQKAIQPNLRGFGHIAFETDEIQSSVKKVVQNGGEKFGELTEKKIPGLGLLKFIYVRDPDGNLIELQNWTS